MLSRSLQLPLAAPLPMATAYSFGRHASLIRTPFYAMGAPEALGGLMMGDIKLGG